MGRFAERQAIVTNELTSRGSTEQAHSGVQGTAPLKGTACEGRAAEKAWFDSVRKLINVS